MKEWIWTHLADPVLRRVMARMEHLSVGGRQTNDGSQWRHIAAIGKDVSVHRDASLVTAGQPDSVEIGDFCQLYGSIWMFGAGQMTMKSHSFLGPGSRIWCSERVVIGSNVLISHMVDIHDSNSHSMDWQSRRLEIAARFEGGDHSVPPGVQTAPVVIEDDVWIGFKSSILKGVTIGRGAVVAAGSVVTKDVPSFSLVAGNPAVVIRELPKPS